MYYEDYFGITAPMAVIVGSDISELSQYRNINLLVNSSKEFLNELQLLPSPEINKVLEQEFNLSPLQLKRKLMIPKNAKETHDPKYEDSFKILDRREELTKEMGVVSEYVKGVQLSEPEQIILRWFYHNRKEFDKFNYEESIDTLFKIQLETLSHDIGINYLYKNYKQWLTAETPTVSEMRKMLSKMEFIKNLMQPKQDLENVTSLYDANNDLDFIDRQPVTKSVNLTIKNIYFQLKKKTSPEALNSLFGLDLTASDYYRIGRKFDGLGFIGFNPYTPELFKLFITRYGINSKQYTAGEIFTRALNLLIKDLTSCVERSQK